MTHSYLIHTILAVGYLSTFCAPADTITIRGTKYDNVLVRETENRYYIQNPQDGTTFSVSKTEVSPGDVVISPKTERDALQAKWLEKKGGSQSTRKSSLRRTPVGKLLPDASSSAGQAQSHEEDFPFLYVPRDSGLREVALEQRDGSKVLVVKGTRQKDPAREQRIREQLQSAGAESPAYPTQNAMEVNPGPTAAGTSAQNAPVSPGAAGDTGAQTPENSASPTYGPYTPQNPNAANPNDPQNLMMQQYLANLQMQAILEQLLAAQYGGVWLPRRGGPNYFSPGGF